MQLNYGITSEFAAMKCLTYIAFLLPPLRTNRFKFFSNNTHIGRIQKTRPPKWLNHQNKFWERGLLLNVVNTTFSKASQLRNLQRRWITNPPWQFLAGQVLILWSSEKTKTVKERIGYLSKGDHAKAARGENIYKAAQMQEFQM